MGSVEGKTMRLIVDFNNVMSDVIGPEHGIKPGEIDALKGRAAGIHRDLQARRKTDIGFYNLPYDKTLLKDIIVLSKELAEGFDNLVVLGIGGSALGAKALFNALCHPYHNLLLRNERCGLRVFFCDNIDPDGFQPLLEILNLKKTVFNVITKSGETAETIAQFMVVKKLLERKVGRRYREHIIITTDPVKGALRNIADKEVFKTLPVPQNVGGRYSALSAVGLLPSAMAGIDIKKLFAGARYADEICSIENIWKNPAYMAAILQYLAYQKGKSISVIMPYSNSLKYFAEWYVQLWAESLGKRINLKGEVINCGQTPVGVIGTTDQHSQLQLYMEGPYDKVITFIEVKKFKDKVAIPKIFEDFKEIGYLGGHTLNELFHAEQAATL